MRGGQLFCDSRVTRCSLPEWPLYRDGSISTYLLSVCSLREDLSFKRWGPFFEGGLGFRWGVQSGGVQSHSGSTTGCIGVAFGSIGTERDLERGQRHRRLWGRIGPRAGVGPKVWRARFDCALPPPVRSLAGCTVAATAPSASACCRLALRGPPLSAASLIFLGGALTLAPRVLRYCSPCVACARGSDLCPSLPQSWRIRRSPSALTSQLPVSHVAPHQALPHLLPVCALSMGAGGTACLGGTRVRNPSVLGGSRQ